MTNQVYVHIGLPKTATTTLQLDYFPYVNHEKYLYLGVLQPRTQKVQDSLFTRLINAARYGKCIAEANQALRRRLASEQRSLILSDEMLTVSSIEVSWQEQLSNLARILEGTNHKLLATVREPVSAMFSYYVELYEHFQKKGRKFHQLALTDNDFRIYHYDSLLTVLTESFDAECIHIQKFEDLVIANMCAVVDFLDHPAMEPDFAALSNHNQKKKTKGAVLAQKRLKLRWVTTLYHWFGGNESKYARALKHFAQKPILRLRNSNYRSVPVPVLSYAERQDLKLRMSATMNVMADRYGIKY